MSQPERASSPEDANIRYTVPYDWGSVRVTQAAHQAYALTPLNSQVLQGACRVEPPMLSNNLSSRYAIYVNLLGPEEIAELTAPIGVQEQPEEGGLGISALAPRTINGAIEVNAGFNKSLEKYQQELIETAYAYTGGDEGALVTEDGVTLEDFLRHQQGSQMFAMRLAESVGEVIQGAAPIYYRNETQNALLEASTKMGAVSLAFSGAVVALGHVLSSEPVVLAADGAVATGIVGRNLWRIRRAVKYYFQNTDVLAQSYVAEAATVASKVAEDIFTTYSTQHFDLKAKEEFGGA